MNRIWSGRRCPPLLRLGILGWPVFLLAPLAEAQVVPATPKKWTTRSTGGGGSASVGIEQAPEAPRKVRRITYVVLSPQRQFVSNDGKSLLGKLVAFEQTVTEVVDQDPDPAKEPVAENAPPTVTKPTVVKDGKVRLLVSGKIFELPLTRLSSADQTYITDLRQRIEGPPPGQGENSGQAPATSSPAAK